MKVLVECSADEAVLRTLGVPKKQLSHFGGKDKLITQLKDVPGAVGMVDEDPDSIQHPDLKASYRRAESAEGLRLMTRQGTGGQRLVVICPKLEDWLIERAKSSGIRPEDYGLPSDPDRLHSIPRYEQKEGFRRFLAELKERDRGMRLCSNGFARRNLSSNERRKPLINSRKTDLILFSAPAEQLAVFSRGLLLCPLCHVMIFTANERDLSEANGALVCDYGSDACC